MEAFKIITTVAIFLLISSVKGQNGQISTPCTASMISTFTPCLNYITGSSANGSSPTSGCCDALKSVMSTNMDCACLMVTASVPLPLNFVNRTLALALPRFCKHAGVPLQCKAAGVPLPAPGPVQFATPPPASAFSPKGPLPFATPPPASAFSPQASKATAAAAPAAKPTATGQPPVVSPPVEIEVEAPTATHRVRPVVTPSASSGSMISPSCILKLFLMGFMLLYIKW